MLGNHHNDLVKYEYLTRVSPQNFKNYVMTMVEAAFDLDLVMTSLIL